jgi:hypothetical protein
VQGRAPPVQLGGLLALECRPATLGLQLGTQEGYWRSRASYEAIETALWSMRMEADAEDGTRIAMTCIAVGYGRLSWRKVRATIEAVSRTGRARSCSTRSTWRVIPVPRDHV